MTPAEIPIQTGWNTFTGVVRRKASTFSVATIRCDPLQNSAVNVKARRAVIGNRKLGQEFIG